jgi:hypothetical protein
VSKHDQKYLESFAEALHADHRIHERIGPYRFVAHLLRLNNTPEFLDAMAENHSGLSHRHAKHFGRMYRAVANFKRSTGG